MYTSMHSKIRSPSSWLELGKLKGRLCIFKCENLVEHLINSTCCGMIIIHMNMINPQSGEPQVLETGQPIYNFYSPPQAVPQ